MLVSSLDPQFANEMQSLAFRTKTESRPSSAKAETPGKAARWTSCLPSDAISSQLLEGRTAKDNKHCLKARLTCLEPSSKVRRGNGAAAAKVWMATRWQRVFRPGSPKAFILRCPESQGSVSADCRLSDTVSRIAMACCFHVSGFLSCYP